MTDVEVFWPFSPPIIRAQIPESVLESLTKTYGIPKPLLSEKHVYTYLTHGAPALPVHTIYINSVKWRLQLGVFSFVFGWFNTTIRQFFSVPFCSDKTREKYLERVKKDVAKEIKQQVF